MLTGQLTEQESPIAVNLYSSQESSLERNFGDAVFPLETESETPGEKRSQETQNREIGFPLLGIGLFLLLVETWVFLKRGRP